MEHALPAVHGLGELPAEFDRDAARLLAVDVFSRFGGQDRCGRVPTVEIMTFNPTVTKLVLEGKDAKLPDAIRIGAEEGMQDFTMSLKDLVDKQLIDRPTAMAVAPNQDALKMAFKGIQVSQPGIL